MSGFEIRREETLHKQAGAFILLVFALLTALFFFVKIPFVFENSAFLALQLIVLQSAIPIAVAYFAGRSYSNSGLIQLLILGCAILAYGIFNIVVAFGVLFMSAPGWTNFIVTVHNSGLLIFSATTFLGALVARLPRYHLESSQKGKHSVLSAYLAVAVFVVFFGFLALVEAVPPFVVLGEFTLFRQIVLGATVVLLVSGSILLGTMYLESKLSIIYWFALGLVLTAVGVVSILLEPALGTPLSWTGRAAQYVGCAFLLVAVLAKSSPISTVDGWVEAFKRDKRQFDLLSSKMNNAFAYQKTVLNERGNPPDFVFLEVNEAFERMTGLQREKVVGKKVTEIFSGARTSSKGWISIFGRVAFTGQTIRFEDYLESTGKWYSVSAYRPKKGYLVTLLEEITERKRMEEALRQSQEKYKNLTETTADFIWEMDSQGRYTYCSPQMEKLWGIKPAEMIGKAFFDLMPPNDKKRSMEFFAGVGASPKPFTGLETTAYVSQEGLIYLETSGVPFFDDNGKLLGFRGITRDITERKKTEEALRESEKRFRQVFESANVGKSLTLPTGEVKFNTAFCEMLGYTQDELRDKKWQELTPPEEIETIEKILGTLLSGEKNSARFNKRYLRKDGSVIWADVNTKLVSDVNGKPLHYITTAIDITERHKAETALAQSEKKYRRLYETSQDGIMARDLQGQMIDCNDAYARMLGYTKEELSQLRWQQVLPEKWHEQRERIVAEVIQSGRSVVFEREYLRKDGSVFPASVRTWQLTDENGTTIGTWSLVRDVTEQKELQRRLRDYALNLENLVEERTRQLKDAERLATIGQTAGMVGHDIRNPLQAISGGIYLAKLDLESMPEREAKENIRETLNEMEKSADYIDKIVMDLQDYAKPLKPFVQETDLNDLLQELLLKTEIPENIKASFRIDKAEQNIVTDSTLLNRILGNLVANAVQAMPQGGRLTIRAHQEAEDTVITVQDSGVGIPEDVKPKLFTPLFTTKAKGQGFGLAVVKRMTEALNGNVTFESQEGKGTKFIIRLPATKKNSKTNNIQVNDSNHTDLEKRK